MKITLFLSTLWLAVAALFTAPEKAILLGKVTDDAGEGLVGATVLAVGTKTGTLTDVDGNYRLELAPGTYTIEFAYTGFATQRVADVKLEFGKENRVDVALAAGGALLEEVVVTSLGSHRKSRARDAAPTRSEAKKAKSAATPTGADRAPGKPKPTTVPAKGSEAPPPPPPAAEPAPADDIIIVDGHKKEAVVTFDPETYEEKVTLVDVEDSAPKADSDSWEKEKAEKPATDPAQPKPRAGLLTAGEWNDLHNWNAHWADLLSDGEIEPFQKMYGFHPRYRYALLVTNDAGFPVADAVAQLKTPGGTILWEARTDNTGKAELWAALFDAEYKPKDLRAEVWLAGKKHEIHELKSAKEGFNFLKINVECHAPKNVDIVWAVDATGSMGDEIEYLKTELLDVIGRAKSHDPALAFRMGTVFYRDKGDEYITKSSGLSPDIEQTVAFIQKQSAGGGGDYPEAVHSALEEAIFSQKWSTDAVARICFLVLDASPHQAPEVNASLQKSIREAARLGIRIVPVAASGVQKDTEFLMKFFGLATNGSYVFLTDHSGIGGKHLEPTTDEYKVELLNDLLVRLITEYTSIQTCEGKSQIRFEGDPQQPTGTAWQAMYYPNPAADRFTLELPFEVESVSLYDAEGRGVRKLEKPVEGANSIVVNDLAPGFYTIRILNAGRMQSGKLMVVR
jgi:hypothetical protein